MRVIRARNVNNAWATAKRALLKYGVRRPSRAGDVLEYPEPVATVYKNPTERVLFDPVRDANPFFHFMEGLWMLAGRNDVQWIKQFNSRMGMFSDDSVTFHGAYGHRWRNWSEGIMQEPLDQLPKICKLLKNHNERRAVLQMWNPWWDLGRNGVDVPCNTNVYFKVRGGKLCMTVCNRSNDIIWGCYGANVVHMSMLQEYIAAQLNIPVGEYTQVSDSWHAYEDTWTSIGLPSYIAKKDHDAYAKQGIIPFPLAQAPQQWDYDLQAWIKNPIADRQYDNRIFDQVARPMYLAWGCHKLKDYYQSLEYCREIIALDWQVACTEWIVRRMEKHGAKQVSKQEGFERDGF